MYTFISHEHVCLPGFSCEEHANSIFVGKPGDLQPCLTLSLERPISRQGFKSRRRPPPNSETVRVASITVIVIVAVVVCIEITKVICVWYYTLSIMLCYARLCYAMLRALCYMEIYPYPLSKKALTLRAKANYTQQVSWRSRLHSLFRLSAVAWPIHKQIIRDFGGLSQGLPHQTHDQSRRRCRWYTTVWRIYSWLVDS